MEQLDVPNVRQLEDLIIDAIYKNIINGKLDQKKKCLNVDYAMGRDVRLEQRQEILAFLKQWLHKTQTVLHHVDEKVKLVANESAHRQKWREDHEAHFQQEKSKYEKKAHKNTSSTGRQ